MKTSIIKRSFHRNMRFQGNSSLSSLSTTLLVCVLLLFQDCKKHDKTDDINNPTTVKLLLISDNLASPVSLIEAPDQSNRLFVVDQIGKVWIIGSDGKKLEQPFIDISSKLVTLNPAYDERGLLGLAFHPDFKNNGKFYLYYTAPPRSGGPIAGVNWNHVNIISEFRVAGSTSNIADAGSERLILAIDHPQSNHNGGSIAFGPDGYLYISIGDGGGANDTFVGHVDDWYKVNAGGNGQDISANLLGNILRIDVNAATSYSVPADNPFVGKTGRDEIWAFGFRNPYRFSFDQGGSRQLFSMDAGQALYEEIDIVTRGGNYGWNVKEGTHCFNAADSIKELASCPSVDSAGNPLIDPIIELKNSANPLGGVATTIIGGYVYRGTTIPSFQGRYIFGIFSQSFTAANAKIFSAAPAGGGLWPFAEINIEGSPSNIGSYLKGFGQDAKGEIYLLVSQMLGPSGSSGRILKLVSAKD